MKRLFLLGIALGVAWQEKPARAQAAGGEITDGLRLGLVASAAQIRADEPFSVTLSLVNRSETARRILPMQEADYWTSCSLTVDSAQPTVWTGYSFHLGVLPALRGLRPIVPLELKPGQTLEGRFDLKFWSRVIPKGEAATPLFSIPGTYRFHLDYWIGAEAAAAFGISKAHLTSPTLQVVVAQAQNSPVSEPAKPWQPSRVDLDGNEVTWPQKDKISAERHREVEKIWKETAAQSTDSSQYGANETGPVSFTYYVRDGGDLTFSPLCLSSQHRALLADPAAMSALRARVMALEKSLRDQGVEAYAAGDWNYIHLICGNR